jgi:DNA modification methylase
MRPTQSQPGLFDPPAAARTRVTLYHGDCLKVMPTLAPGSVHMVFADLPYACTNLSWDTPINLEQFWQCVWRLGAIGVNCVMTATQPFATTVINSQPRAFQYETIWRRIKATNPFSAKRKPMRAHENILTFFKQRTTYNPQKHRGSPCKASRPKHSALYVTTKYRTDKGFIRENLDGMHNPVSVQQFDESDILRGPHYQRVHPTQKPVALLEWLIKTYTNPGDTILDPVAGSGTTAIAAMRTGRHAICIEKDPSYFEVMRKRVAEERVRLGQKLD